METTTNNQTISAAQSGAVDYAAALRQYNRYGRGRSMKKFCEDEGYDYWKFCKLAKEVQIDLNARSGNDKPGFVEVKPDGGRAVEGGNLVNNVNNLNWQTYNGNLVISANIINHETALNLSGLNYIAHAPQYRAGEKFELKLAESSVNPPSSVSWTVNGQASSGSVTLTAGTTVVQARLTYGNGRTETVEARLKVVN